MPDEPQTPVPQDETQQHLKKIAEAVANLARSTDSIRDEVTKITRQNELKSVEALKVAEQFLRARMVGGGLSLLLHAFLLCWLICHWLPQPLGGASTGATVGFCVAVVALVTCLVLSLFVCCRRSDD